MGQKPQPHLAVPQYSASFEPAGSQRAFFHGVQGKAPARRSLVYTLIESEKVLPLLIPPVFGVDRHLFGSGVPSLEDRQPCPCLICIKEIRITGLAPPLLGSLHRLNCLSHEPKNGPRFIILAYIELEVAGGPPIVGGGLPERVPHGLSFIPVRDVPPT
ncbi:hypothetical protein Cgig2_031581 [Carnegiea gigantea]|uniref:Uncharacterized protein n=1 Tax=Carnegiea gigantea TaxID=171969 RepID=A0A9Q1JHI8_9CARY|nr:hypothetical protein Cgig2_031581 [Carnegiea gigantea]